MNKNFKSIIWITGYFGATDREVIQSLVYHGKFNEVSANRTLAKLVNEYKFLKKVDRGKKKTNAYFLTHEGVKYYRQCFGAEPKVYNSLDKLSHSIQISKFYCHIIKDMAIRGIIKDDFIIIEEKNKINFSVHNTLMFPYKNQIKTVIPDGFCVYKYGQNRALVFNLEIENSNRKSNSIATKTIGNYEGYFISQEWVKEKWQPKNTKIFPPVLVVCYSDWKVRELIRWFNKKKEIPINYFFTSYNEIEEQGISADIWLNLNGEKIKIIK